MTQPIVPTGTRYIVTFDRIGRNHDVPPLEVTCHRSRLEDVLFRFGRNFLASRDIDVVVNDDGTGMFLAGMHNGGTFTYEAVQS